jgi:hypothetical protein
MEKVYGAVPPVGLMLALYEVPITPEESEVVDIVNVGTLLAGGAIITGTAWDASPVWLFWT